MLDSVAGARTVRKGTAYVACRSDSLVRYFDASWQHWGALGGGQEVRLTAETLQGERTDDLIDRLVSRREARRPASLTLAESSSVSTSL